MEIADMENDDHEQMRLLVRELAQSDGLGRDDPTLLRIAERLRTGTADEKELQEIKRGAISYAANDLVEVPWDHQAAFLSFIVQSELIVECAALRQALYKVLQPMLTQPLDRLTVEISTALMRSSKPPTSNLVGQLFEKVIPEYRISPDWRYVGLLAKLVDRTIGSSKPYTQNDFISDLGRLATQPDFERNLMMRNAVWSSIDPRLDAITILNAVRRRQHRHAARHPTKPDFAPVMEAFRKRIAN
jgi:hypothetical protein